jgi:hypothetical protein
MVRTFFKLAFVALIANATWHMFGALSPHYKFKDGVQYAALYRGDASDDALREKVLSLAAQFEVPVTDEDIKVKTGDERHTIMDISYVRKVELAPGFTYPLPLSVHVDTYGIRPAAPGELVPK